MAKIVPNAQTWFGFIATLTGTVATGPKVADVTAAIDLTPLLTGLNISTSGNAVPTPTFDQLFETNIVGTVTSTFTADFYRDAVSASDLAWTTLPRGTSGYVIWTPFGGIPSTVGNKCQVWPIQVLSRSMANLANNTVETFTVTCTVPSVPNEDATTQA